MKPTKGQIVIYVLTDADRASINNNGELDCAAVVATAWNDGKCNLRLLTDSDDVPPWRTSVEEGTAPGTWHEPRV